MKIVKSNYDSSRHLQLSGPLGQHRRMVMFREPFNPLFNVYYLSNYTETGAIFGAKLRCYEPSYMTKLGLNRM